MMQIEFGQVVGDVSVSGEMTLNGQVVGTVTVVQGGHLILNGMVSRNVSVDAGGVARINGMVVGDVINNGGAVEIFGRVKGHVHELAGRTLVHSSASIDRAGSSG
jgi:cytoskeletal protein CcmA (bactofilin family)